MVFNELIGLTKRLLTNAPRLRWIDPSPALVGEGMRLTPAVSTDAHLTLESERMLPGGAVELEYAVS